MFWVRFRSSVILVIIGVAALLLGNYVLWGLLHALSLIGMMELSRVVKANRCAIGIAGYLGCIGYYLLLLFDGNSHVTEYLIAYFLLLMFAYVICFPKSRSEQVTMVFFSLIYVALLLSYVWQLREADGGVYLVWMIFVGSWGSDTCAYLVGRKFGKHKIVPKLSPKKSWEGCIGGVLGTVFISIIYAVIVKQYLPQFENPILMFAITGAASSVISQLGDWAASAIKRNHEVKDYGTLIPGHGGVMDRFDSVIFVAPVIFYLTQLFI